MEPTGRANARPMTGSAQSGAPSVLRKSRSSLRSVRATGSKRWPKGLRWRRMRGDNKRGNTVKLEGGCYCGSVRYVAEGEPMMKAQCHCRECQYISGGSPNMFVLMPIAGFSYNKGTPRQFSRSDLEGAVTREFCAECGTHLLTRRPGLAAAILKVGTLDDPSLY